MTKTFQISGRLVQGSPFEGNTKNGQGKPLLDKNNNPRTEWHIAVAVPKTDPNWPAIKANLDAEAAAAWPQGQNRNPAFSNKIEDGDSTIPNKKGVVPNTRPGFPGHWVVHFTNGFPPDVYAAWTLLPEETRGPQQDWVLITDPNLIKKGYHVRVFGDTNTNNNGESPGMYMNMSMVALIGYGEVIVTREQVSAADAFGAPPNAVGSQTAPGPGTAAPPPATSATASPSDAPPPPHTGYMDAPPPPPAGPVMTPKANGVPYASFIAKGWTDDSLRQAGYIV